MNLTDQITQRVVSYLSSRSSDPDVALAETLRLLSKWRSVFIQNTFLREEGTKVLQGPFKDMEFLEKSAEGCHIAKLLGCYEQPLQPFIEKAILSDYSVIINIGCAEGYYAVGLARAMPSVTSLAFDTDPIAQKNCRDLALKNGVSERVKIYGSFTHAEFSLFTNETVLVLCDIEGAEETLLDPSLAPALEKFDIIVESHECIRAGITKRLMSRFDESHDIQLVEDYGTRHLEPSVHWFAQLSHLDQLLATWEWRSGPTPWLVMSARSG